MVNVNDAAAAIKFAIIMIVYVSWKILAREARAVGTKVLRS